VKVEYSKLFLRDVEGVRNRLLLEHLEKQIEKFKSAKRLSDAGQVTKLGSNAFRVHIRDYRLGFFLNGDTITLHRFLDRKDMYRFFP
jgi:mRNA interferase RelE/StbE